VPFGCSGWAAVVSLGLFLVELNLCDVLMNNDLLPTSKSKRWLMGNYESTLPGLIKLRWSEGIRQLVG